MSTRGQYGNNGSNGRVHVGAFLVHTLELKQRFNNAKAAAVQMLLNDLASNGVATSVGLNRWEIALKDGVWVLFTWYPEHSALEVTITDREVRRVDQMEPTRRRYEAMLRRITPRLQSYGATTVGAAIYAGPQVHQQPRAARPSEMVFDMRRFSRDQVGLTIYHSVGDRANAVKQMAIDWNALYQNLGRQAGVLIADPKSSSGYRYLTQHEWDANIPDPKKVQWWKSYAEPLFKQWAKFKIDQLGGDRTVGDAYIAFAERWQTNWDVYENWKKKLDNLRVEATKQSFNVDTPKPTDLPTTVWADVGDVVSRGAGKVASGLGDVWNIVKYGAWAVLGLGAVVAISSVASNLRSGKDPAEKYVEMIRAGRRPYAPRELPAPRAQLALPPGEVT